jgi:hypothetical protein
LVENTVIGFEALGRNTSATRNTAMGWYALSASTNNGSNTAIGAVSQRFSTGGTGNTSVGEASLFSITTGDFNSAVGQSSLGGLTDGANNVAIGYYAGATLGDGATDNTTADNSIYIGSTAYASQSNGQNEIVIGANNVGHGSNTVTLGNSSITRTVLRGNVGINKIDPAYRLDVQGQTRIGFDVTASAPSGTDILSTSTVMIGGSGGNYLTIGQYGAGASFAQWIQSSFQTPNTAVYPLLLNPLGGNVGIGTAAPSGRLTVADLVNSGTANVLYLSNTSQTGTTVAAINFINIDSTIKSSITAAVFGNDYMTFNVGSNTERVRINASGDVGIGTNSPQSRLQIFGGSLATGGNGLMVSSQLTTGRTGTFDESSLASLHTYFDSTSIEMAAGSTSGWVSGVSVTGNNATLFQGTVRFLTQSAERVRINASGNVGINTTSPTSGKLQVAIGGDGAGITLERTTSGFFTGHGFTSSNPYFTYYATSQFIMGYGTSTGAAPSINTLMLKNTGQIQLPQYTTTTSFTGTAAGVLAFDSSGNVLTIATPGGGSAVTGQIILTAGGGWPSITSGANPPILAQTATNQVNFYYIGFPDGATTTFANWAMPMPSDYNGGTITAVFYWAAGTASTNSVRWGLAARAYADGDVLDAAFGTQQQVTDANQANDDVNISAATPAITIGGTPAAGNFVQFRANRNPADAADNLAATAELLSIRITYTRA